MSASSDTTIGRHSISTKTVPVVGINCTLSRDLLSAHTSGCAEGAETLGSEKLQHTVAEWTPCVALDDSGECSMAVVDSVLRISRWRRQDLIPCNSGIIMALHTALLEGGGQECAGAE